MEINIQLEEPKLLKIQKYLRRQGVFIPFSDHIDHDLFHRCRLSGVPFFVFRYW